MRSTRASAAWAGIAMATSFLSVLIIGTQPHSNGTRALTESVAMTSTRDALSNTSLRALKQANVASPTTTVRAD